MTRDQLARLAALPVVTPAIVSQVLGTPIEDTSPFEDAVTVWRRLQRADDDDVRETDEDALLDSLTPNPAVAARYRKSN
jgi:hypothetical protein